MGSRFRRARFVVRKAIRRIAYAKGSPASIAGGAALGIFIGLTPTMGFQMIPAAFFAAVLRVNVVAAVLAVWITNPVTAAPIYYFEYFVGKLLLPFEPGSTAVEDIKRLAERISEVSVSDLWRTMAAAAAAFAELGWDVIVRLLLGSFTCAAVGAALTYPATYLTVRYVRRRREARTMRRADVRLERLDAAGLVRAPEGERAAAPSEAGVGGIERAPEPAQPPRVVPLPLGGAKGADERRRNESGA